MAEMLLFKQKICIFVVFLLLVEMFIFSIMQGYALLCVGFPSSDVEVETQDEDEVIYMVLAVVKLNTIVNF